MKTNTLWIYLIGLIFLSCNADKFLDIPSQGTLDEKILANEEGIDALLIGAYSMLDGIGGDLGSWPSSGTNWVYGDVMSDDSHLGGASGSCCGNSTAFEIYEVNPNNTWVHTKWLVIFESIQRTNIALKLLKTADIPNERKLEMEGEARFLRGHYYFEAKKLWLNLPFFDEEETNFQLPNYGPTTLEWIHILTDFQFAADHLPAVQEQPGRASKYAAHAYLGKVYLFAEDYPNAKIHLEEAIQSGVFELMPNFYQNFDADYNNNQEAVFQVQMSVNDGTINGENGNFGDILNYPAGSGPVGCCGFHQPTQNLVNAYRVDENGLPYLDNFNAEDVKNDDGLNSDEPFEPSQALLDPRLDWTVGRRGIPYHDWGIHPGEDWIRDQFYGGPYSPKKRMFRKSQDGTVSTNSGWTNAPNSINYSIIRYADVLLWRAEVAVEENDLETARVMVNKIRQRAQQSEVVAFEDGTPAANYQVELYNVFPDQVYARKAVYFERRLELAMEGHRFFDLVRWGIADRVLNTFVAQEVDKRYVLRRASFQKGKNEYLPIPAQAISESVINGSPTLQQNPGY